jgi:RNA polymerase sigma factor (sigma-70 family)
LDPTNEASDDVRILQQFANEQTREAAFTLLLKKYTTRVYSHVRRIVINHDDADDVVQNTFIQVWLHLNEFRSDSKLYTWLYRIATNEAIKFLNKKRTRWMLPLLDVEAGLSKSLVTDPYFNGDAALLKLQQAILTLPEKQRLVFNMKYFENMKYEDMSEVLGTSVGALKASYHHAVKKLEKYLS